VVGVVADKTTELHELCRRYKVQRLELFGSAAREDFDAETSDLDFLVEFLPMPADEHGDCYWALLEALEDAFGREVDLVETPAIQNPYFLRVIARTRTLLYPRAARRADTRLRRTRGGAARRPAGGNTMPLEAKKFLYDTRLAIDRVGRFCAGKSEADYLGDELLRSATERQLAIVGEALYQLLKIRPDVAAHISDAQRIVRFRHILIHAYDEVSNETVWRIVGTKLPLLRQEVEALLATPEEETEPGDTGG
jgi:uncharacterized protein with HEPN domain/predicted nucleotidyltransferase